MLTILDGRKNFFQWDTEQKLIVSDELVKEIHFSNAVTNPALVCEVFEEDGNRVVNVPNILLQQDWNIKAYGCCDLCVRQYAEFEVIRRNKPADYVYTETEIKRYEDLEARIEELEKNGGGTGGGAVASVNGKVGEVVLKAADVGAVPTSRTINSKPLSNNITLNASDIGAIGLSGGTLTGSLNIGSTSNTSMYSVNLRKKVNDTQYVTGSLAMNGSDLRIQNSVSTKRSGSTTTYTTTSNSVVISDSETSVSKPILFTTPTAKDDTRESLSVYSKAEVDALIPEETDLSGYYTKAETDAAIGAATDNGQWEMIEHIKVNEEGITSIERTAYPDGTPYNLAAAKVIAKIYYPFTISYYGTRVEFGNNNNTIANIVLSVNKVNSDNTNHCSTAIYQAKPVSGVYEYIGATGQQGGNMVMSYPPNAQFQAISTDIKIDNIKYALWNGDEIPVGTTIEIWGVRA